MSDKRDVKYYLDAIEDYRRVFKDWEKQAESIMERYSLGKEMKDTDFLKSNRSSFHILYSQIQTLKPAVFSTTPTVIAERRHKDADKVGRIAAEVIERASSVELERNNFKVSFDQAVLDTLISGRGVTWVRFDAKPAPPVPVFPSPADPTTFITQEGAPVPVEVIKETKEGYAADMGGTVDERTYIDYVGVTDFAHSPEKNWADVVRRGWVARRMAMSKEEGKRRFGAAFKDAAVAARKGESPDEDTKKMTADVWEIWDAHTKTRHFLVKGVDKFLKTEEDPYDVEGFFPCSRPSYGVLTNSSLKPTPDFMFWKSQADELDRITGRIDALTEALKAVGVYSTSAEALGKLMEAQDGQMIPVSNLEALLAKGEGQGGGLRGVVAFLPIHEIAQTLIQLYQAREQVKALVYEVSGVSDILRGQVNANEKATQSKLKAQFAGERIVQRRRSVEVAARDTLRIMVEVMLALFSPETLRAQSGFDFLPEVEGTQEPAQKEQLWQAVYQVLSNDRLRDFRLDVETDSTIEVNSAQQQTERNEFLTAVSTFMERAVPLIQTAPDLTPALMAMLLFTTRGFRAGRSVEASLEQAQQAIENRIQASQQQQQQAQQAAQQPPQPDPAQQAAAQKAQVETQKLQGEAEIEQQKAQLELQARQMELEHKEAMAQLELQIRQQELENKKIQFAMRAGVGGPQ